MSLCPHCGTSGQFLGYVLVAENFPYPGVHPLPAHCQVPNVFLSVLPHSEYLPLLGCSTAFYPEGQPAWWWAAGAEAVGHASPSWGLQTSPFLPPGTNASSLLLACPRELRPQCVEPLCSSVLSAHGPQNWDNQGFRMILTLHAPGPSRQMGS